MTPREKSLLTLAPDALAARLKSLGQPAFRADQLLDWVYAKWAASFDDMRNLPMDLRAALKAEFTLDPLAAVRAEASDGGDTVKTLFELADGRRIESVAMRDGDRHTFCISSQVGCPLGCVFCATGRMGFERDLTAAEMLGQVRALAREAGALRNVVFMGMGEPLLNIHALLAALEALTDARRFGVGARRITISTAGVPDGIDALAHHPARPNLALSLNSPFAEQRARLMPVERRFPLRDVLAACDRYARRTGRRIFLEYVLIGGVNTSRDAARAVAHIAKDLGAAVNLIAHNPVGGCDMAPPGKRETALFADIIRREGLDVTERFRRGRGIHAACGQLRAQTDAPPPR